MVFVLTVSNVCSHPSLYSHIYIYIYIVIFFFLFTLNILISSSKLFITLQEKSLLASIKKLMQKMNHL